MLTDATKVKIGYAAIQLFVDNVEKFGEYGELIWVTGRWLEIAAVEIYRWKFHEKGRIAKWNEWRLKIQTFQDHLTSADKENLAKTWKSGAAKMLEAAKRHLEAQKRIKAYKNSQSASGQKASVSEQGESSGGKK